MSAEWPNISVGDEASFEIMVTEDMVSKFVEVSGDDNPLHADSSFAVLKGFSKKVAHGMLLGSLFSRLVGRHFFGDDNLYISQTLQFRKPVLIGDTVLVKGVITDKIESAKILRIRTTIESGGTVAISGEAQVTLIV
ncbi:MAG: MaoC family dehydratase [Patescibacteria group bacterium]